MEAVQVNDAGKHRTKHQLSAAQRLRQDYASRAADDRPMSHSVAVAYRQLIARCEQQQSEEHKQP